MLELQQLVSYVTPNRLKRLSFFRNSSQGDENTQMQQLYHAIFNDEIENDKEACQLLFGKDKDRRYAKVKHRLKQQMLDTVLLLEPIEKGLSDYHESFTVLR